MFSYQRSCDNTLVFGASGGIAFSYVSSHLSREAGTQGPVRRGERLWGRAGRAQEEQGGQEHWLWSTNEQCHLNHTLPTYGLHWYSQDSALGILSVWRVERDDSTPVSKLGFPGQWNGSGNVSSGGESLLFPQEELISQECSCVLISKASVLSPQTLYCHGDSLLLSNEESELQAP